MMRSSPAIGLLAAAVEEVGDVRIFLGLRHAQLRAAGVGDDLAEDVGEASAAGRSSASACRARRCIASCRRRRRSLTVRLRGKPEKSGSSMRAEDFAHAVGAEVEAQHAVAVLHAAIVADHGRQDELVELLLARRRRRSTACGVGESAGRRLRRWRRRPWRRAPSACRGPWRSSGRTRSRSAPTCGSAAAKRLRSSPADCGGVSRPSVKACTTRRHAGVGRGSWPAPRAWSWCECTPPGETRPIRWQVPPLCLQRVDQVGAAPAPARSRRRRSRRRCAAGPASPRGRRRC